MTRQTSFLHQQQVLKLFSRLLAEFGEELTVLAEKYERNMVSLYEEQGLMEEIFRDYQTQYMQSMTNALAELSQRVANEDAAFVEKEIDFISSR